MIRSCLLLASLLVTCAQAYCPYYGFVESDDGGCFQFFDFEKDGSTFDFDEAQDHCKNYESRLATILSYEENDFIANQALSLGWGDAEFFIGLRCFNDTQRWSEHCYFGWDNFHSYDDSQCIDDTSHFILSATNNNWRRAPDGLVVNKIVCSISSLFNGCLEASPEALSTQYTIESIILGASGFTVLIITIAVCGCFCMFNRRYRKKKAKEEEERKWRNAQLEANQFNYQVGNAAVTAIGVASTAKALERTASMRYTPFPRAEGKGFDEWEIDRRHVSIDYTTKLGQGAFGSVYLESADKVQQMQFFEEIELMKRLGYHERLVNMLACATQSEPALLIIEFCAHGDLLNYMRERRQIMLGSPDAVSSIDRSQIITQKQQLMFCVQIAYGMEYLSQRGFVHRDIAARNILVDQHESCKIGDFGLCREVEKEDEHYHSRGGRLPLKWMSPEAIEKYDFTIASDVWSFGVLLFEIITLGGNPYPDWPAAEILNRLKRGRRMERPDNCTDHMFTVMNSCWHLTPTERPTFSELRMKMGIALEEVSDEDYYLKLNAQAMYYTTQSVFEEMVEVDEEEVDETLRL